MIASRLHWREQRAKLVRRVALAASDSPGGSLMLSEFWPKKYASPEVVQGEELLAARHRGRPEVLDAALDAFRA